MANGSEPQAGVPLSGVLNALPVPAPSGRPPAPENGPAVNPSGMARGTGHGGLFAVAFSFPPSPGSGGRGLRASAPDQVSPCRGHTPAGAVVTSAQPRPSAAPGPCRRPLRWRQPGVARRLGAGGERGNGGAGGCAGLGRELEGESAGSRCPSPAPALGRGRDPCLLNQEGLKEVGTGLGEG